METMRPNVRDTAERLAIEADAARAEVQSEEEKLRDAEAAVGEISGKILDATDEEIPGLAVERSIRQARVEAIGSRLANKRRACDSARAASDLAERELSKVRLREEREIVAALDLAMEERLTTFAREALGAHRETLGHVSEVEVMSAVVLNVAAGGAQHGRITCGKYTSLDDLAAAFRSALTAVADGRPVASAVR